MVEKNYRQIWEEANGPIPKGMHIHHILPRYMGGTDELDNLQLVTPEEHYDIHFERGEYGAANLIQTQCIDRDPITHPMVQFDLQGHRIKTWSSQSDISRSGYDARHARECALYIKKSSDGYQWFYESEVGDIDYIGPVKRIKNTGGKPTNAKFYIDIDTLNAYSSGGKAAKAIYPDAPESSQKGSCQQRPYFKWRMLEITKEEYYYLNELKQL